MDRKYWAGCAAAVIGVSALSGCTPALEKFVDTRVNDVLPRYFGPADHYETHVHAASDGAILRGHIQEVEVIGTQVQLRPDLRVDMLRLDAEQVDIDTHARTVEGIGSASFTFRISGDNLNRCIVDRRKDIKGLRISIEGDRLVVRARPEELKLVGVPVMVRGTLAPETGGYLLDFHPDRARISFVTLPSFALRELARKLNPVVDLTKFPIPIQITGTTIRDGALEVSGTVDPDALLRAARR